MQIQAISLWSLPDHLSGVDAWPLHGPSCGHADRGAMGAPTGASNLAMKYGMGASNRIKLLHFVFPYCSMSSVHLPEQYRTPTG